MPSRRVLAAYVPVLHQGYLKLFDRYPDVTEILVFDKDILKELDYIRKDLRALSPVQQQAVIEGLNRFNKVDIMSATQLAALDKTSVELIMPDEDISRAVASKLKHAAVVFEPVFLRWDRRLIEGVDQDASDITITEDAFAKKIMAKAMQKAGQSSDIWRRVGAVLIADDGKEVGAASNQGEPSVYSPWMTGDPRNIFNRGVGIEMSVFTHAEANLIAEAARRGVALAGASLYVTTFPCPACAKLIAHSGIKTCYYVEGYAVLDGKQVLDDYDVKLVRVKMAENTNDLENPDVWVPYKK